MAQSHTPENPASETMEDPYIYLGRGLSLARIGCQPQAAVMAKAPVQVAVIVGQVLDTKIKEDPKTGEAFVALSGNFTGVNQQTGARYRAGLCFLPGAFHEMLLAEHEMARKIEGGEPVEFALAIWAVPSSSPIGYSYEARSLVEVRRADPLAHLLAKAAGASQLKLSRDTRQLAGPAE